jgi:hypothetical protein
MAEQTVTVNVPDGWEAVAYREPTIGEWYLTSGGVRKCDWGLGRHPWLIVRPAWVWPEWITAEWIAMEPDGLWFAHERKPVLHENRTWVSPKSDAPLTTPCFAFDAPPCSDWTQSLRRNPHISP